MPDESQQPASRHPDNPPGTSHGAGPDRTVLASSDIGLSRRDFVGAGSVVGAGAAIMWSAPTIRSIRLAANAGSPMPTPTTTKSVTEVEAGTTTPTNVPPATIRPPSATMPQQTSTSTIPAASTHESARTSLPFTGAEITETAVAGATAIVAGRALMAARRRTHER
jgi:hypothetical protein